MSYVSWLTVRRFWLTPRWIAAHAAILAFVVACVLLARWQLDRLDERRTRNVLVETRSRAPAVALEGLAPGGHIADEQDVTYRRVSATGTYDVARQVLLVGRTRDARPGNHVLTPLVTPSGYALIVDRGWVPLTGDPSSQPETQAVAGRVRVEGVLIANERGFGQAVSTGNPPRTNRIDVRALAGRLPYRVFPLAARLTAQDPRPAAVAPIFPLPERLGDGPHKSYAIQWLLFALVAVSGWVAFVRHAGRRRAQIAP